VRFRVRRFLCTSCEITVSCLPCFAQPYRLINHTTLEAFLMGERQRRDVQARQELLQRYVRRFAEWWPSLLRIVGYRFGRAPPKEEATAFWRERWRCAGPPRNLPRNWLKSSAPPASGPTAATNPPSHSRRGSARRRRFVPGLHTTGLLHPRGISDKLRGMKNEPEKGSWLPRRRWRVTTRYVLEEAVKSGLRSVGLWTPPASENGVRDATEPPPSRLVLSLP